MSDQERQQGQLHHCPGDVVWSVFTDDLSDENIIIMRQLSRFRIALVDNCGDCKRRIIALLDQVFPEYVDLFPDTLVSPPRSCCWNARFSPSKKNRPYEVTPPKRTTMKRRQHVNECRKNMG